MKVNVFGGSQLKELGRNSDKKVEHKSALWSSQWGWIQAPWDYGRLL